MSMDSAGGASGQEKIWEYFQNDLPESFSGARVRLRYVARLLEPGRRVLNVGIGAGIFEEEALARKLDVHSLDPDEKAIGRLRERLGMGEKAKTGYIQTMPFPDNYFDAVVLSEIIEHLPEDVAEKGLAEARRVLVPGGRVVGTVPSREDLRQSVVACPKCSHVFHRWGHQRSYDPASMTAYLARHLAVERVYERPFIDFASCSWYQKIAGIAKRMLGSVGVRAGDQNLVFIARKPPTS
jgi:ubiquinone/menaquinone biosynthesis C-methylase UbiE